jgi:glutamate formiminotransferase
MNQIVECVPNFSEGRSKEIVEQIISEIQVVPLVKLLDHEMDANHNRAVVTFIGEPEGVLDAAYKAIAKAAELIDMEKHEGGHPRIGATDVVPFIPIKNITTDECVKLANELAQNVAENLHIPVYLYEDAAKIEARRDLAYIRRGQYEGLKEAIAVDKDRKPDFGPSELHPSAGAVVIGVRMPLIAYNVNLNTDDLELAKSIAKKIRFKDGGFKYVKAIGLKLHDRGIVQVSMNLTNYRETPIPIVYDKITELAYEKGVEVIESEIIGLIPNDALVDSAVHYLKVLTFQDKQVLENRLGD